MSVLKPAFGAGREFTDLLRSHANQDHPQFEILVGLSEADEAARHAVQQVQAEFPRLRIQAVQCPATSPGCNGKVEVLERLAVQAGHGVWVATDADIRVPRHLLRSLCRDLARPGTGLVTCLYRAEPGRTAATKLESLWIGGEFSAQVLLAGWLQGMRFALGAAVALRKATLQRAGGFQVLRHYIGDDYQLGAKVAASGARVELSEVPVATHLPVADGWANVWKRQVRWARTIRLQRPLGHAGLAVTFGSVWAATAVLIAPGDLWPAAIGVVGLRLLAGAVALRCVSACWRRNRLWALPAADCGAFLVWLASFCGRHVAWGGRRLRLGPEGRISD